MYHYKATLARIVDADTIDLNVDLGFNITTLIRVRLLDVDAPEIHGVKHDTEEHRRGEAATEFVRSWLEWAEGLELETKKTGKYGRWLGVIHRYSPAIKANPDGESVPGTAYDNVSLNQALGSWIADQGWEESDE